MSNDETGSLVLGMIIGGLIIYFGFMIFDNTYKDGQTDALSGNIKYSLSKQANDETVWRKIKP